MNLFGLEYIIKCRGQFLIVIMNQATKCLFSFFDCPNVLPSLLRYLLSIRIGSDPGQMNTSCSDFQEEEHIVSAQEKQFNHKEITAK